MPLFAKVDVNDEVVQEVSLPANANKPMLNNGKSQFRPILIAEQQFNENTHRHVGFTYSVTNDAVVKNPVIVPISLEEQGDFRLTSKLEKRANLLPHVEARLEIIARVLEGVTKTLLMMEDEETDPRTKVLVDAQDFQELKDLVTTLKLI